MNWRREKVVSLLLFVLLGLAGCGKIKNPQFKPDTRRRSWLFFNYSIENPHAHPAQTLTNDEQNFAGLTLTALLLTNYFPQSLFREFTLDTKARFNLTIAATPEEIVRRLLAGEKYDLTMAPGYLIQRFIAEGRLHKLNHQNLSNLNLIERTYQTNIFDPKQTFAVPYLWSVAGIAYNSDHFDEPPRTWGDLLDPAAAHRKALAGKISLLPGPYRAAGAALVHLGKSPNTLRTNDLILAETTLLTNAHDLHYQFFSSELASKMSDGEILIAQCYGYDAEFIDRRNPKVDFVIPSDGTWVTITFLTIPATATPQQKELAEAFVNFLLDPRIAGSVVKASLHASVVEGATAYVPPMERSGPSYMHPDEHRVPLFAQTFEKDLNPLREELWVKLQKAAASWEAPAQAEPTAR